MKVGSSGVDVCHMWWWIGGGPPAVLLQDVLVGFGVKVCPPHQHLGNQGTSKSFKTQVQFSTIKLKQKPWNDKLLREWGTLCKYETPTWPSAPPEAKRSPALEKATVITAPWKTKKGIQANKENLAMTNTIEDKSLMVFPLGLLSVGDLGCSVDSPCVHGGCRWGVPPAGPGS